MAATALLAAGALAVPCALADAVDAGAAGGEAASAAAPADLTWESNTSIASAAQISLGQQVTDATSQDGPLAKWYTFTLSEASAVTLDATAYYNEYGHEIYRICDAAGETVWDYGTTADWNETTQQAVTKVTVHLTAGTYYFGTGSEYDYGALTFKLTAVSDGETTPEAQNGSNNSIGAATPLALATPITGQLAVNDEVDFYTFTLEEPGTLTFEATAQWGKWAYGTYRIYDAAGNELWKHDADRDWNDTTRQSVTKETAELVAGTYYVSVEHDESAERGVYTLEVSLTPSGESFPEGQETVNNSMYTASPIEVEKVYTGQTALNDDVDFYTFTLASGTVVQLDVSAAWYTYDRVFFLYDGQGEELWHEYNHDDWNETASTARTHAEFDLAAGTYYFAVAGPDDEALGSYTFQWHTGEASAQLDGGPASASAVDAGQQTTDETGETAATEGAAATAVTEDAPVADGKYSARMEGAAGTLTMKVAISGGTLISVEVSGASVAPAEYAELYAACIAQAQAAAAA